MPRLIAPAQRLSRSHSTVPVLQSSVLETTRNLCMLVSNLGSGAQNAAGLQAAGLIGCQIVDIVEVRQLVRLPG